jgi:hypothetical protein
MPIVTLLSFLSNGAFAAVAVGAVTLYYSHRRFGVENFERLRRELRDDPQLRTIKDKLPGDWTADLVTEAELRDYLEFFEVVGNYWRKNLIDRRLLNEILADYILDIYEYPRTKTFILAERDRWENDRYYENFNAVAKWCVEQEEREKQWTTRRRSQAMMFWSRWSAIEQFTGILAIATILLVLTSIKQCSILNETMKVAQRPWVGPIGMRLPDGQNGVLDANNDLNFLVDYENSGKEPARNFHHLVDIEEGPPVKDLTRLTVPDVSACREVTDSEHATVFPNQPNFLTATRVSPSVSNEALSRIYDGSVGIYVFGCFTYDDGFGTQRTTRFCEYLNLSPPDPKRPDALPKMSLTFCPRGNYAD